MKKIFFILLIFSRLVAYSQQPIYNQYALNPYLINPAIAGYKGYSDVNLVVREQWVGYVESPSTQVLSGQHRILKTSYRNRTRLIRSNIKRRRPSGRVGLGGIIYNDVNGSIRRTGLQGTYSYHIYNRDIQYSMGLSLSFFQFKSNITQDDLYNQSIIDPIILNNSILTPDANIGFLISTDNFYTGLSAINLFQNLLSFGNSELGFKMLRQYYVIGGYKYQQRRSDYAFEPFILLSFNDKLTWNLDLNVKIHYMENYWIGLSLRTNKSFISMFGINYNNMYLGYSFGLSWGDVSVFNKYGTHEIILGVKFGDSSRRYRWINRF